MSLEYVDKSLYLSYLYLSHLENGIVIDNQPCPTEEKLHGGLQQCLVFYHQSSMSLCPSLFSLTVNRQGTGNLNEQMYFSFPCTPIYPVTKLLKYIPTSLPQVFEVRFWILFVKYTHGLKGVIYLMYSVSGFYWALYVHDLIPFLQKKYEVSGIILIVHMSLIIICLRSQNTLNGRIGKSIYAFLQYTFLSILKTYYSILSVIKILAICFILLLPIRLSTTEGYNIEILLILKIYLKVNSDDFDENRKSILCDHI